MDSRTDVGKQPRMRRACDNKETNIVSEALRIAYCVFFFFLPIASCLRTDEQAYWNLLREAIGNTDSIVHIFCL